MVVSLVVHRIDGHRWRGLGQTIGLQKRHPGHLLPALGYRYLNRHAAP